MWTQARITIYLTTALAGGAVILASMGFGSYDPETWTFDAHPIDVRLLAGVAAGPVASALAAIAAWKGWGKK